MVTDENLAYIHAPSDTHVPKKQSEKGGKRGKFKFNVVTVREEDKLYTDDVYPIRIAYTRWVVKFRNSFFLILIV